jgi:hypothetical protein
MTAKAVPTAKVCRSGTRGYARVDLLTGRASDVRREKADGKRRLKFKRALPLLLHEAAAA